MNRSKRRVSQKIEDYYEKLSLRLQKLNQSLQIPDFKTADNSQSLGIPHSQKKRKLNNKSDRMHHNDYF